MKKRYDEAKATQEGSSEGGSSLSSIEREICIDALGYVPTFLPCPASRKKKSTNNEKYLAEIEEARKRAELAELVEQRLVECGQKAEEMAEELNSHKDKIQQLEERLLESQEQQKETNELVRLMLAKMEKSKK